MHLDVIFAQSFSVGKKDLKNILIVAMENLDLYITSIHKIFLLLRKI